MRFRNAGRSETFARAVTFHLRRKCSSVMNARETNENERNRYYYRRIKQSNFTRNARTAWRGVRVKTMIFVKRTLLDHRARPTFGVPTEGWRCGRAQTPRIYLRIIPELQILLSGNEGEDGEDWGIKITECLIKRRDCTLAPASAPGLPRPNDAELCSGKNISRHDRVVLNWRPSWWILWDEWIFT